MYIYREEEGDQSEYTLKCKVVISACWNMVTFLLILACQYCLIFYNTHALLL